MTTGRTATLATAIALSLGACAGPAAPPEYGVTDDQVQHIADEAMADVDTSDFDALGK